MRLSIRNIFAWIVACVLILCGFVRRAKSRAMRGDHIISVYFHKPSRKEFEACIKWLKKNKFTFLSTADVERIVKQKLPFPKGAVLITVDDGWQSNEANVVEVANKYQVPVTIFVSTGPVEDGTYWWSYIIKAQKENIKCLPLESIKKIPNSERLAEVDEVKKEVYLRREAMTVEQVKNAAGSKYVTIGGHTHSHPILVNCLNQEVYSELELSKEKLESWVGKEVAYFSYPNGDYGMREIQMLRDLNYRIAFCSDQRPLTPESLTNRYLLPRFSFLEGASFAENKCRVLGVWKPLMLRFRNPFTKESGNASILLSEAKSKRVVALE